MFRVKLLSLLLASVWRLRGLIAVSVFVSGSVWRLRGLIAVSVFVSGYARDEFNQLQSWRYEHHWVFFSGPYKRASQGHP